MGEFKMFTLWKESEVGFGVSVTAHRLWLGIWKFNFVVEFKGEFGFEYLK